MLLKFKFFFKFLPISILIGLFILILKNVTPIGFDFKILTNYTLASLFALIPLGMKKSSSKDSFSKVKKIWLYSILQHFFQWGIIGVVSYYILGLASEFVSFIPGGFVGGYGSAALMGEIFEKNHLPIMRSYLMVSATLGMFFSILGGIYFLSKNKKNIEGAQTETQTYSNLKSLLKILIFVATCISFGLLVSFLLSKFLNVTVPLFAGTIISSFALKPFYTKVNTNDVAYLNIKLTDLLVVVGLSSIELSDFHADNLKLIFLVLITLLTSFFMYKFLAPKVFPTDYFEQGLFTIGWSLGGLMMGFLFLKEANEKNYTENISKNSLAYMFVVPLEVFLFLFMPKLLMLGFAGVLTIAYSMISLGIILYFLKNSKN